MKRSSLFFAVFILIACNNRSKQSTESEINSDTSNSAIKIQIPNVYCYLHVADKDMIYLKMEKFPNVITGTLAYKFHEKDKNNGDIDGILKGDTLIADYTFMSEGKSSARQVIFLIQDSVATEGYGAMEEKNGKMVFKDLSNIDFSKGTRLTRITCPTE